MSGPTHFRDAELALVDAHRNLTHPAAAAAHAAIAQAHASLALIAITVSSQPIAHPEDAGRGVLIEEFQEWIEVIEDPVDPSGRVVEQLVPLAVVLMDEFGGPTDSESTVQMAIRLLREHMATIEQLTYPATRHYRITDSRGAVGVDSIALTPSAYAAVDLVLQMLAQKGADWQIGVVE